VIRVLLNLVMLSEIGRRGGRVSKALNTKKNRVSELTPCIVVKPASRPHRCPSNGNYVTGNSRNCLSLFVDQKNLTLVKPGSLGRNNA